jgi:hypothetical protein
VGKLNSVQRPSAANLIRILVALGESEGVHFELALKGWSDSTGRGINCRPLGYSGNR